MRLTGHGLAVDVPVAWEGEIYRRDTAAFDKAHGGTTRPVLHLANFALPAERGDYGSNAVEMMRAGDTFTALLEFEPAASSKSLFSSAPPVLTGDEMRRDSLQRPLPNQAGSQSFFQVAGRAFCLYVVVGDYHDRFAAAVEVNDLMASLEVDP